MTREKVKNKVRNLLDLTFLQDRTTALPMRFGVAISTVCDLKCPHCMREALGVQENKFMDIERLIECVDDFRGAERVTLFGLGEPFLHPRFFDVIELYRERGIPVSTSSHGMSLKPGVRERMIESGLDEVTISMDGARKELFEKLRVNAKFDAVTENIRALVALKKERNSETPRININMTVMRENLAQAPELIRLAHSLGANSVSYSSIVVYKAGDFRKSIVDTPAFERTMDKARRQSERLGIPMSFWRQKPVGWESDEYQPGAAYGCFMLWSEEIIERDGMMKTCCYIEEDIADALGEGPAAAFNSDAIRRERRALMEGRVRPECQGCMYLRERAPSHVQAHIDAAAHLVESAPELAEEDRADLRAEVARVQAHKEELYPDHVRRSFNGAAEAGESESIEEEARRDEPAFVPAR